MLLLVSFLTAIPAARVLGAFDASSQSAGAVVLVNSKSARYADFQRIIQPYLDNFGFPYSVLDISTNVPAASISNCALIVLGHNQLDTNLTYLTLAVQSNITQAVASGTGLVSFDSDLGSNGFPRYQFVQTIFGFSYGTSGSGTSVTLPTTEPGPQMHFVTSRHPANDTVTLRSALTLANFTVPASGTVLARVGTRPLVTITPYGQGRALQWTSYDWMISTVLGPMDGLDDVVWRGLVWAARKPFVMRGMPNFVTMRIDDVEGPFDWLHAANAVGFKPFVTLFFSPMSSASIADLRNLVTNGNATASIHAFSASTFFYFNHNTETANSDIVQSNNFYVGTQWHLSHGIPISKVCATHYSEIGVNCFAGLKAWGMEFVPIEVVPGTVEYVSPGAPWLIGGPFRLYEPQQPGQVNWPTYYADWLTVPGHPEFDGQFFNIYSEVRDVSSCYEWCPDNNVTATINRGTTMLKHALDSLNMATLFSHEWYIHPTSCCGSTTISTSNWRSILEGITNNLASYKPIFVTLDYASQYVRAKRTSRLESCSFDPNAGLVNGLFVGKTDLDTEVSVFVGADAGITNVVATVPAFTNTTIRTLASFGGRPSAPAIVSATGNVITNAGSTVLMTVTAVGTAPLVYQWVRDGAPLSDQGDISGATTPVLTIASVDGTNSGNYSVIITNTIGAATSETASLSIALPPQFISTSVSNNGVPSFAVLAVSNITYQIQVSADLSNWAVLTNLSDSDGVLHFTDFDATNVARRFYRAAWMP